MKLSRSGFMRLLVDLLIAAGWVAALWALNDIDTRGEWAVALGATVLAGLFSGRWRILIVAIGGVVLAALLLSSGASCDPSTCEDDLSPVVSWVLFLMVLTIPAGVMAVGVLVRKVWGWHRDDTRGSDLPGESQPR